MALQLIQLGSLLIELLLVVGILAVVFAMVLPFALNTKFTNELDTAAENLRDICAKPNFNPLPPKAIRRMELFLIPASSPAIYIDCIAGTSYADRDTSFNAGGYGTTELPKSAIMSFNWTATDYEITFERLTGELFPAGTADKTITLSIPRHRIKNHYRNGKWTDLLNHKS